MNIIIVTPFKVGSSTLSSILENKFKYQLIWEGNTNYKEYMDKNKIILRGHTKLNYDMLNNKEFDIWFTLIRKPTDMYLSGYFQVQELNINKCLYSYYFGKENVLKSNDRYLLKHFLNFKWNKMQEYSYDFNFRKIQEYTGINIYNEDFDKEKGYAIYQSPIKKVKVVVICLKSLYDKINDIFTELNISKENISNDEMNELKRNDSNDKWYKNKYNNLKKILPDSYFNTYKVEDDKIINKFL